QQNISGAIPRAIRGGNPLQMLNPLAPAKYGTAEENVSLDSDVPGKGNGINLFSISFYRITPGERVGRAITRQWPSSLLSRVAVALTALVMFRSRRWLV